MVKNVQAVKLNNPLYWAIITVISFFSKRKTEKITPTCASVFRHYALIYLSK